jgi:PAP2 superfamily
MKLSARLRFAIWQIAIVAGAIAAYFGVRGLTEGDPSTAHRNAERVLDLERAVGLNFEQRLQDVLAEWDWAVTLGNWVYIWIHWPILIGTLIWLLCVNRPGYVELRNAIIISGLIGLVIFATFPVAPPRLFDPVFVDTVTERSYSYRVLQPPAFVNRYAAVPSLHFGWNLLVAIAWFRIGRSRAWRLGAIAMPAAMAWAVVATANHWVFDVVAGAVVALSGLAVEVASRRYRTTAGAHLPPRHATAPSLAGIAAGPPIPPSDGVDEEPAHAAREMVSAGGRSP